MACSVCGDRFEVWDNPVPYQPPGAEHEEAHRPCMFDNLRDRGKQSRLRYKIFKGWPFSCLTDGEQAELADLEQRMAARRRRHNRSQARWRRAMRGFSQRREL